MMGSDEEQELKSCIFYTGNDETDTESSDILINHKIDNEDNLNCSISLDCDISETANKNVSVSYQDESTVNINNKLRALNFKKMSRKNSGVYILYMNTLKQCEHEGDIEKKLFDIFSSEQLNNGGDCYDFFLYLCVSIYKDENIRPVFQNLKPKSVISQLEHNVNIVSSIARIFSRSRHIPQVSDTIKLHERSLQFLIQFEPLLIDQFNQIFHYTNYHRPIHIIKHLKNAILMGNEAYVFNTIKLITYFKEKQISCISELDEDNIVSLLVFSERWNILKYLISIKNVDFLKRCLNQIAKLIFIHRSTLTEEMISTKLHKCRMDLGINLKRSTYTKSKTLFNISNLYITEHNLPKDSLEILVLDLCKDFINKYIEKEIIRINHNEPDNYHIDMNIYTCIQHDNRLIEYLFQQIHDNQLHHLIDRWSQKYNVTTYIEHINDKEIIKTKPINIPTNKFFSNNESSFYNNDHTSNLFELPLDENAIFIVDKCSQLQTCLPIIFNGENVGIDLEWEMSKNPSIDRPSLIQLANKNSVFIIDMIKLEHDNYYKNDEIQHLFFGHLFMQVKYKILGYALSNDLKMLKNIFPRVEIKQKLCIDHFLDLQNLSNLILNHQNAFKHFHPNYNHFMNNHRGLSLLVYKLFGQYLNKGLQKSNWKLRPLTQQQIEYSALDAYILLPIHEKLLTIAKNLNIKVNDANINLKCSNLAMNKFPLKGVCSSLTVPSFHTVSLKNSYISNLNFICANNLEGLCFKLRLLGSSCKIAKSTLYSKQCKYELLKKMQKKSNLIFLSSGKIYDYVRVRLGESRCICVDGKHSLEKQVEFLIDNYELKINMAHLFTRCVKCNHKPLIKVSSKELSYLREPSFDTHNPVSSSIICFKTGCFLETQTPIRLEFISNLALKTTEFFEACVKCGQLYYEGTHCKRWGSFIESLKRRLKC